jgi:hypothetical protein
MRHTTQAHRHGAQRQHAEQLRVPTSPHVSAAGSRSSALSMCDEARGRASSMPSSEPHGGGDATSTHASAKRSTSCHASSEHASSGHPSSGHATSEHATSEHATSRHASGEHASGDHTPSRHASSGHATSEHATSRHASGEHASSEHGCNGRVCTTLYVAMSMVGKVDATVIERGVTPTRQAQAPRLRSGVHSRALGYRLY